MGVLKLSVIEEQNKQLKNKLRIADKKAMLFALVIAIVLVSASLEKAKSQCVMTLPLQEVGTLIKITN